MGKVEIPTMNSPERRSSCFRQLLSNRLKLENFCSKLFLKNIEIINSVKVHKDGKVGRTDQ